MFAYVKLADTITVGCANHRFDTGVTADPSATSCKIFLNGSTSALSYAPTPADCGLGLSITTLTFSGANGFTVGDYGSVFILATQADGTLTAVGRFDFKITTRSIEDLAFPQTSGRGTLVAADGSVSPNWADVKSPTTTLNLSGTSTKALEPSTAGRTLDVGTDHTAQADVAKVTANATAAANMKLSYDGAGPLVGASFPARQADVDYVASATGGVGLSASSRAITTGTEAGTLANTNEDGDGTTWDIAAVGGVIDVTVDVITSSVPKGIGDELLLDVGLVGLGTVNVFARQWSDSTWKQRGQGIIGAVSLVLANRQFDLRSGDTNTDSDRTVRFRFYGTGLGVATLKVDSFLLAMAAVPPTVAEIQSGLATAAALATAQTAITDIQTDVDELQTDAAAGITSVLDAIGLVRRNTAQTGSTSTTIKLDASASSVDDKYNGLSVYIVGGTGIGQERTIDDYVGSTRVATVDRAWATTPDATSVFVVRAGHPTLSGIAEGVWTAIAEGSATYGDYMRATVSGIFGKLLNFTTGTLVWKSIVGSKTRWTVTRDSTGRLTSVPGDLTP